MCASSLLLKENLAWAKSWAWDKCKLVPLVFLSINFDFSIAIWFSGHTGDGLVVGPDDPRSLFQP